MFRVDIMYLAAISIQEGGKFGKERKSFLDVYSIEGTMSVFLIAVTNPCFIPV